MTIGFAGLSHLGIVSSVAAASKGFDVIGFDPDRVRSEDSSQGWLPVIEPGLAELLEQQRARLRFTTDPAALSACDVMICSADVPTDADFRSDLSEIQTLLDLMIRQASLGTVFVVLSQVPPGFTRQLAHRLVQHHAARRCSLFYQVETLIIGRAMERALQPERFMIGCADPLQPLPASYATLLEAFHCPVLRMGYESAELAKIAINMFLASSVSTTNTLAEVCEAIGADWSEIVPALALDKRIGPHAYLRPGLGLSGGNLERDLATVRGLAEEYGTDAGIIEAWLSHSRYRREWALKQLHAEVLSRRADPVIAVWGLAYKPQTRSTKHSAALTLIDALCPLPVRAYDPAADLNGSLRAHLTRTANALEACRGADALIVMTPWPEFSTVQVAQILELMRGRVIIDPFGVFDDGQCAGRGVRHLQLGASISAGVSDTP